MSTHVKIPNYTNSNCKTIMYNKRIPSLGRRYNHNYKFLKPFVPFSNIAVKTSNSKLWLLFTVLICFSLPKANESIPLLEDIFPLLFFDPTMGGVTQAYGKVAIEPQLIPSLWVYSYRNFYTGEPCQNPDELFCILIPYCEPYPLFPIGEIPVVPAPLPGISLIPELISLLKPPPPPSTPFPIEMVTALLGLPALIKSLITSYPPVLFPETNLLLPLLNWLTMKPISPPFPGTTAWPLRPEMAGVISFGGLILFGNGQHFLTGNMQPFTDLPTSGYSPLLPLLLVKALNRYAAGLNPPHPHHHHHSPYPPPPWGLLPGRRPTSFPSLEGTQVSFGPVLP